MFIWHTKQLPQFFPTKKGRSLRKTFSSVQWLSCVLLFITLWTAECQASLFITNSQSLLKLMSIESVMPSNHLTLCHSLLLLLPSIFPSIRVFSNESVLHIRWPKYWSFSSYYPHNMRIEHWYVLRLGTHSVSNLRRVIRPQSHGRRYGKDDFTGVWL